MFYCQFFGFKQEGIFLTEKKEEDAPATDVERSISTPKFFTPLQINKI